MHIDYCYGTHRVRCEVKNSPALKVSAPIRGLHPDTVAYAVKRALVKDPVIRASVARKSYGRRLEKGKRRKPLTCTVSGPASGFGLPGKTVRAVFTVSAEGVCLLSAELTA